MASVTLVYWRDIPAQVMQGKGRGATRVSLSERFEQAIDRAAMKAGLSGTDDYLSQWRRESLDAPDAASLAAQIETEYDSQRIRALIDNAGFRPADEDD
ncbi:virulence factor [Paracoccus seriniphilus]|uniref:Virulence factor n=1 Tax=Paracoccus seriniphilus TaxID=184748 RepID=A0A239PQZ0_9RHOB|nr:virulence factor [Paracoccus seriniphilus]WCR12880.1 virulence factor [Paracoccus seriniphilus]SNT72695.1 Virulence factor [Paracoccus seriniphilus]